MALTARRWLLAAVAIPALTGAVWIRWGPRTHAMANSILVIAPYRYQGTWVFDDPEVGLTREPFVAGIPEMIDELVQDIPGADRGFRLYFSATAFPGHQKTIEWVREDGGGNWYRLSDTSKEGWLCPALFRYYETAPRKLFVKAEAIRRV